MNKDIIYRQIRNLIKKEVKPIPKGILMEKVKNSINFDNKHIIYDAIDELINKRELKKLDNGYLVENYINGELTHTKLVGKISINTVLDGYVKVQDGEVLVDYYVNNINLNNALNGDDVEIILMDKYNPKTNVQHAVVSKIVARNTLFGVGEFKLIGNTYDVVLDDKKFYLKVKLDDTENLVNGHKILMQFKYGNNDIVNAAVSKIIGHVNDVGADILSIVYGHGVNPNFDDEIINYVNKYVPDAQMDAKRRDISSYNIVSIDPKTSKDLDDAVYVKKHNDHFFLSVSIADVSSYVPFDSILDLKTLERSTSIYLVDRVIAMLPHKLSNDQCSLNPEVQRRALTCDMKLDFKGNIISIDVFPSWIVSKNKLSYDEVNGYFNGKPIKTSNEVKLMLDEAKELHHILRCKKMKEGYIDFEIKEPKIIVDEKCFPIDIQLKERGTAQMMIEDFMVAANNAVTIKAKESNIPFIYRIHDKPSPERLAKFVCEIKKWPFKVDINDISNPSSKSFSMCIQNNANNPNVHILSKLLLKCMSKAVYSVGNIGHFGLAIKDYTHFTSPIRRYPDLIVHRLYWMYLLAPELYSDEQREKFSNQLSNLCEWCTEKEINAMDTERSVNSLKFCQYMSKRIGQVFDGMISTITSFGFFVELPNSIEGLVRIKNIGGDYWVFNSQNLTIVGERTKKVFNFGDNVKIRVLGVNIELMQIDFEVVGFENNVQTHQRRNNYRKVVHY